VPASLPPKSFSPAPLLHRLPAHTPLWRVHGCKYAADTFNPRLKDVNDPAGGRFDGTDRHVYSSLYAGLEAATALSETLLRDVPFNDRGFRQISRFQVRDRRASVLVTERDLVLVDLRAEEALNAVAQDHWLVTADSASYHLTRHWAGWIREQVPAAQGLVWQSLRHQAHQAVVLFGDRCEPVGSLVTVDEHGGFDLGDADGADRINHLLAPHRARVDPPRRRP
jgi:hypothetical protein